MSNASDSARTAVPDQESTWVFFGPNGLRAGWALAVFLVVSLGLTFLVEFLVLPYLVRPPRSGGFSPGVGLLTELGQFVPFALALVLMSVIERRSPASYGYQGSSRMLRFLGGLAWGFLAISVLVLTLWKMGCLALGGVSLNTAAAIRDAVLWGAVFLLVGLFEESMFRGYVQFTLMRGIGFWWGALVVAAFFGLAHRTNPGESPVGLASVVGAGVIFSLSLWYTGSLWWGIGFHAAWDWGQSYFYGTADSGIVAQGHLLQTHPVGPVLWSGGATGPEGSILVVPVLLLIGILMVLWWGRRTQSPFAGAAWKPQPPQSAPREAAPAIPVVRN